MRRRPAPSWTPSRSRRPVRLLRPGLYVLDAGLLRIECKCMGLAKGDLHLNRINFPQVANPYNVYQNADITWQTKVAVSYIKASNKHILAPCFLTASTPAYPFRSTVYTTTHNRRAATSTGRFSESRVDGNCVPIDQRGASSLLMPVWAS